MLRMHCHDFTLQPQPLILHSQEARALRRPKSLNPAPQILQALPLHTPPENLIDPRPGA